MKRFFVLFLTITCILFNSCQYINQSDPQGEELIGGFTTGATLLVRQTDDHWGIVIEGAGLSSLFQPKPVQLELYKDSTNIIKKSSGYETVDINEGSFTGEASIKIDDVTFKVSDSWRISGNVCVTQKGGV